MNLVFDSNVYIAALLNKGFIFKLLKSVLDPQSGFSLFISHDIETELKRKLEIFRKDAKISREDIEDFLTMLQKYCISITIEEKISAVKRDPADNKILECAVAAEANLIVSMDKDLLRLRAFRNIPIVHPKTFSFMMPKA